MIPCPNCLHQNPDGAQFCGQCGCQLASASPAKEIVEEQVPPPPPPTPQLTPERQRIPEIASVPKTDAAPAPSNSQGVSETDTLPQMLTPEIGRSSPTYIQLQAARLVHLQSNTFIELPHYASVMHVGKPNNQTPPDIDVAGFPHSEVVSRIHANIRVESGHFFIEDVGSSNGTYINNIPLLPGKQHRLQSGDRIALGKGDLVTFLFQLD